MQAAQVVDRMEAAVGGSAGHLTPAEAAAAFATLRDRILTLDEPATLDFVDRAPEMVRLHADARARIADIEPLIRFAGEPEMVSALTDRLHQLEATLLELAAVAEEAGRAATAADFRQLGLLYWLFSALLTVLIACSGVLILLLIWHNRLLGRAHREVHDLVVDLTRTSAELQEANRRAHLAMEEVQLQNQILQARDSELHTQNTRFDAALNNMSQALCMVNAEQRLIVCNVRFLELFGLSAGVVQPGNHVADVFRAMARIGRYPPALIEELRVAQHALITSHDAGRFLREVPGQAAIAVSHQPLAGGGWVVTYEDVTEQRHAEAHIRFITHHDALTSLPNRLQFLKHVATLLTEEHEAEEHLAVLCLDLDFFKHVNDKLGYPAGDMLLEALANRLRRCTKPGDVVARLGGDEFAILQISRDQPQQAELLAQRVLDCLRQPYDLDGHQAVISVSIGIAIAEERGAGPDVLLRNADMALCRAKADGRDTYRFFSTEMDAQMQARRSMEFDLREAMARQEFEVHYQPIFDLHTNRIAGFEALLRWRHGRVGMIPPTQFIPLAEELGQIEAIGGWVLEQACRDAAHWPEHIKVAVNLSPVQFRNENLPALISQVLTNSGLAAERLELEITESALLQDNASVLDIVCRLRELGLKTVLDDFGTGYSSLSYLRSFPFDKLKIDQSFVREMATRPDCVVIVTSIAELASKLGITTTAEGVETAEQLALVRTAGCGEAQGYYFDSPQPVGAIKRWFEQSPEAIFAA
jgi:diguanylate cyclase (GGDEF)-like protein